MKQSLPFDYSNLQAKSKIKLLPSVVTKVLHHVSLTYDVRDWQQGMAVGEKSHNNLAMHKVGLQILWPILGIRCHKQERLLVGAATKA